MKSTELCYRRALLLNVCERLYGDVTNTVEVVFAGDDAALDDVDKLFIGDFMFVV